MVVEDQQERRREVKMPVPEELPLIRAGENVLFPFIVVPLATADKEVVQLIDAAMEGSKIIGVFAQRADEDQPTVDNFYSIGSAALIARMFKLPDGSIRAFLQGLARIRLKEITQTEPYLKGATQSASNKPATLETGITINVPQFIKEGDIVRIDTRDDKYLERKKN